MTGDDLCAVLEAIERGDVTIKPTGRTADETYAGNVVYRASNGWTIVVFNDCNCWDYLNSVAAPDGAEREYPSGEHPESYDEIDELFLSYSPPDDVIRNIYGFTR